MVPGGGLKVVVVERCGILWVLGDWSSQKEMSSPGTSAMLLPWQGLWLWS